MTFLPDAHFHIANIDIVRYLHRRPFHETRPRTVLPNRKDRRPIEDTLRPISDSSADTHSNNAPLKHVFSNPPENFTVQSFDDIRNCAFWFRTVQSLGLYVLIGVERYCFELLWRSEEIRASRRQIDDIAWATVFYRPSLDACNKHLTSLEMNAITKTPRPSQTIIAKLGFS